MTKRRPFFLGGHSGGWRIWGFCARGAQFLNLSGGLFGKIKVAHRLQFMNDPTGFSARRTPSYWQC